MRGATDTASAVAALGWLHVLRNVAKNREYLSSAPHIILPRQMYDALWMRVMQRF